jgi:hypothetical protein
MLKIIRDPSRSPMSIRLEHPLVGADEVPRHLAKDGAGNSGQRAGGIRHAMPRRPPNCAASRLRSGGRETGDPSRSGRAAPVNPGPRADTSSRVRAGDNSRPWRGRSPGPISLGSADHPAANHEAWRPGSRDPYLLIAPLGAGRRMCLISPLRRPNAGRTEKARCSVFRR